MKKFLRFYLPLLIVIGALGFFVFGYIVNHWVAFKCISNYKCQTVSPAKKAVIKVDDVELKNALVFEANGRFYLVSEVSDDYQFDGSAILIIDRAKNDVMLPNSNCHDVLFSNKLVLTDCGIDGVPYSDRVKMNGFDTQVKITDSNINFVIPNHKIEILFKGE